MIYNSGSPPRAILPATPGDIWQCLETFLIVTTEDGVGGGGNNGAKHPQCTGQPSPQRIT